MPIQKVLSCAISGQAAEHNFNHGPFDECNGTGDVAFVVFGQPAAIADPSEGALDDPFFGQQGEAFLALWPLHDGRSCIANLGQSCG